MFDSCRRGALTAEVRRREDEPATPTTVSPNIGGGPGLLQADMIPCDVGLKLKPPTLCVTARLMKHLPPVR